MEVELPLSDMLIFTSLVLYFSSHTPLVICTDQFHLPCYLRKTDIVDGRFVRRIDVRVGGSKEYGLCSIFCDEDV